MTLPLSREEAEEEPELAALLAGDALEPALLLPEAEEENALAEPVAALLKEKAEAEAAPEPTTEEEGSWEAAAEALELAVSLQVVGMGLLDREPLGQAEVVR